MWRAASRQRSGKVLYCIFSVALSRCVLTVSCMRISGYIFVDPPSGDSGGVRANYPYVGSVHSGSDCSKAVLVIGFPGMDQHEEDPIRPVSNDPMKCATWIGIGHPNNMQAKLAYDGGGDYSNCPSSLAHTYDTGPEMFMLLARKGKLGKLAEYLNNYNAPNLKATFLQVYMLGYSNGAATAYNILCRSGYGDSPFPYDGAILVDNAFLDPCADYGNDANRHGTGWNVYTGYENYDANFGYSGNFGKCLVGTYNDGHSTVTYGKTCDVIYSQRKTVTGWNKTWPPSGNQQACKPMSKNASFMMFMMQGVRGQWYAHNAFPNWIELNKVLLNIDQVGKPYNNGDAESTYSQEEQRGPESFRAYWRRGGDGAQSLEEGGSGGDQRLLAIAPWKCGQTLGIKRSPSYQDPEGYYIPLPLSGVESDPVMAVHKVSDASKASFFTMNYCAHEDGTTACDGYGWAKCILASVDELSSGADSGSDTSSLRSYMNAVALACLAAAAFITVLLIVRYRISAQDISDSTDESSEE